MPKSRWFACLLIVAAIAFVFLLRCGGDEAASGADAASGGDAGHSDGAQPAKKDAGGGGDAGRDVSFGLDVQVTLPDAGADAGITVIPEAQIQGKTTLPQGYTGKPEDLTALAVYGEGALDSTGAFEVKGLDARPQLAMIVDKDGKLVLLGWLKPGGDNTVSTTSTAAYLLFQYSGAALMPPAVWGQAVDLFLKAPETATLAKLLDEKIAANPIFLSAPDQAFFDKVQEVMAAYPSVTGPAVRGLVLVNPEQSQSGVSVLVGDQNQSSNADVNQITFMNEYRRRLYCFIDHQEGTGWHADSSFELEPVAGLNGVLGTLIDLGSGKVAYAPKYYGPVGLGDVETDEQKITYQVLAVGIGGRANTSVSLSQEQLDKKVFITVKAFIADVLIPGIGAIEGVGDFVKNVFGSQGFSLLVSQLVQKAQSGELKDFMDAVQGGDIKGAISQMSLALLNDSGFRDWFFESWRIITIEVFQGHDNEAWKFLKAIDDYVVGPLKVADAVLQAFDLSLMASQYWGAADVERWEVTVRAPKVIITPAQAKLSCGEKEGFRVQVKNGGQALSKDLTYRFTNTADFGHLTSDVNASYKDNFEATDPHVYYTVNTGPLQTGADEITVEVSMFTDTPDGQSKIKQVIGKGKAKVEVQETCESTSGYNVDEALYRSGCTHVLTGPTIVYPGDVVTVTANAANADVCGTSWVWMSYAVKAELDGQAASGSGGTGIYDFCYYGDPQPVAPGGVGVSLPYDGETHTITFYIDDTIKCPVCTKYVADGSPCSSNPGNTKNINSPAIVMSGNGGTHGWSSVKFFQIDMEASGK